MASPIVTLTTDFGIQDGYVAAMKGVILSICPTVNLVDLSHNVSPQDILHGAFLLNSASRYYPSDAIHVAVVDPGVGTARHPLLLMTPNGAYIGPDNGIFTYALLRNGAFLYKGRTTLDNERISFLKTVRVPVPEGCSAYILNKAKYWLEPVSDTFHGRDIFAPASAHLASGVPPDEIGSAMEDVACMYIPEPTKRGNVIQGNIVYIDHFGNITSNIVLPSSDDYAIEVDFQDQRIMGVSRSYASATGFLAIVGSSGYLEVAYRNGNAAEMLDAAVGMPISVVVRDN